MTSIYVYPEYKEALSNIEKFSHLIILWWADKRDNACSRKTLKATPPFPEAPLTGIFTCCSPARPNPIGLTVVKLLKLAYNESRIIIDYIDAWDGTPVIDIKPYLPKSHLVRNTNLPQWFSSLKVPKE